MEDQAGIEPTPELNDYFVLGARHREKSHRERQLEAERRKGQERARRYRAERDRGLEETLRAPRPMKRRTHRLAQSRNLGRRVLGVTITVAVVGTAVYLNRHSSSPPGLAPAVMTAGPCPSSLYHAGSEYRFESCAASDPVGWGRCRTLTVSTDPTRAPVAWQTDVDDALSQLATATGLHFKTTAGKADISISWASAFDAPGGVGADKAGVTQVQTVSNVTGTRLISARIQISTFLGAGRGRDGEEPVLLHELGHAVGLGHYDGPAVMNPVDQGYPTYQSGDLAGLSFLYKPGSCR